MSKQKRTGKRKPTKIIEIRNGWIIYTLTVDGGQDYLTYNDVLLEILNSRLLKPLRHNGRLEFKVGYQQPYEGYWYISDLAYACYHGYVTSLENCIQEMQRYFEEKGELEIEHMDNNTYNNTKYNLLWMDAGLNSRKGVKVTRIKQPNYLASANCDGEYRIQFYSAFNEERANKVLENIGLDFFDAHSVENYTLIHNICSNAEDYVNAIDFIIDNLSPQCADMLKDEKRRWIPTEGYIFSNTEVSVRTQEMLASLDRNIFIPYKR